MSDLPSEPTKRQAATRIRCRKRGPVVVDGSFTLTDLDGKPVDLEGRTRVLLCRCSRSRTPPLCDGSHNGCDFEAHLDDDPR